MKNIKEYKLVPQRYRKLIILSVISVLALSLSLRLYQADFFKNFVNSSLRQPIKNKLNQWMQLEEIYWEEVGSTNISARVEKVELLTLTGLKKGLPLLDVDLDDIEKKLLVSPWIESVLIQKKLPSSLHIQYTVHQARALAIKHKQVWFVSTVGKWIAPFSFSMRETSRSNVNIDLPVLHPQKEEDLPVLLECLNVLEKELKGSLLKIHDITVRRPNRSSPFLRALVELKFQSQSVKVALLLEEKLSKEQIEKLKKTSRYLVKNNILISSMDVRPTQKVVVNVGKRL